MARETAAQKKEREEKAKMEITVSTRTIIKFQGSRYDDDSEYDEYTATFDADSDVVTIEAPCGDERHFKRSALVKLIEAFA